MKLKRLSYKELNSGWTLRPMEFLPDMTLLVGVSGVGKTRILGAIGQLVDMCIGNPTLPISWKVEFSIDTDEYSWEGQFENLLQLNDDNPDSPADVYDDPENNENKIESEKVIRNGVLILERNLKETLFHKVRVPRLSSLKSVLFSLAEEPDVAVIAKAWKTVRHIGRDSMQFGEQHSVVRRYRGMKGHSGENYAEEIRQDHLTTRSKLLLAWLFSKDAFTNVIAKFKEVFPQVEDVHFRKREDYNEWVLYLKERGVPRTVSEFNFSAGMHRTLMHLARLLLWIPGTIILIDEIENSLGVNCINFITDEILFRSSEMQFVITSHHPYIINNVDARFWKIVSRKGGRVSVKNATEFGIKSSSHESFLKLMNLDDYIEGIVKS